MYAYCSNEDCEYNEDGCTCGYEDTLRLDHNGVCTVFMWRDGESDADDDVYVPEVK